MKLLVDIGNTRLKLALWDGTLRLQARLIHNDQPLAIFAQQSLPPVDAVHLSIVPRLRDAEAWTHLVHERCGVAPQIALAQSEWRGLRNCYAESQKLGVDRWLAMVALWHEHCAPFCVVSAGTAITLDRVDGHGQHLGGLILPGLHRMQQTMLHTTVTASTPDAPLDAKALGHDSASAIGQGALFAALGAIERAVDVEHEFCVITGGDAAVLSRSLRGEWVQRDALVLEGLLAQATTR